MENKVIQDYLAYARKSRKIYMIFGIIALVNIAETFSGADHVLRWLTILGIFFYAIIIATLTAMSSVTKTDPKLKKLVIATIVTLILNTANNIAEFVYIVLTDYTWTIFFSLFSLLLQVVTWYIFIGFWRQIDKEAAEAEVQHSGGNPVVTPMQREIPVAKAVAVNTL